VKVSRLDDPDAVGVFAAPLVENPNRDYAKPAQVSRR
jgi:hypothetical protein